MWNNPQETVITLNNTEIGTCFLPHLTSLHKKLSNESGDLRDSNIREKKTKQTQPYFGLFLKGCWGGVAAFGSGESGGDGSPPGSSGGSGRSVSKCRGLCSLSFFTGFGGRISFGLNSEKLIQHKSQTQQPGKQAKKATVGQQLWATTWGLSGKISTSEYKIKQP